MRSLRSPALLSLLFVLGCTLPPGYMADPVTQAFPPPFESSYTIAMDREAVVDAVLEAARTEGLFPVNLDREAGSVQLSATQISAGRLDQFCVYPWQRNGYPIDSFQGWNARSVELGEGTVVGKVVVDAELFVVGAERTLLKLRSRIRAQSERQPLTTCESRGKLEGLLVANLPIESGDTP